MKASRSQVASAAKEQPNVSKVYQTGYQTVQNYIAMLDRVCTAPYLPPAETLRSDQELLDNLGRAYTEILSRLDSELQRKDSLEKSLADTKASILRRQQARKEQTLELDKAAASLNHLIQQENALADPTQHNQQRNQELQEKLRKLQERESAALTKRDTLIRDEEHFYSQNLHVGGAQLEEQKTKLLEEITVLEMQLQHLTAEKQRLGFKHSQVLTTESRHSEIREGIRSVKDELSSKVRQLNHKNDKRETRYWQLVAQQHEISSQLQAVDQEMEELRIENSKMQIATDQMEVLTVGLDQQQNINNILSEKLLRIRTALDQHIESQQAGGTGDVIKSELHFHDGPAGTPVRGGAEVSAKPGLSVQGLLFGQDDVPGPTSPSRSYWSRHPPTSKSALHAKKNQGVIEDLERRSEQLKHLLRQEQSENQMAGRSSTVTDSAKKSKSMVFTSEVQLKSLL